MAQYLYGDVEICAILFLYRFLKEVGFCFAKVRVRVELGNGQGVEFMGNLMGYRIGKGVILGGIDRRGDMGNFWKREPGFFYGISG